VQAKFQKIFTKAQDKHNLKKIIEKNRILDENVILK
jgi:hypothetical protein